MAFGGQLMDTLVCGSPTHLSDHSTERGCLNVLRELRTKLRHVRFVPPLKIRIHAERVCGSLTIPALWNASKIFSKIFRYHNPFLLFGNQEISNSYFVMEMHFLTVPLQSL